MTKILIAVLSLALVGTGGVVAALDGFDADPVRSVSVPGPTTGAGTTTADTTTAETTTSGTTPAGEDVSGPCDEAEHANDPRCTGGGDPDDSDGDDRSGSNSGKG